MKNRKSLLSLFILFALYFPASIHAQAPENSAGNGAKIKWYSFEEAYALNKKKPKKIMVDVFTEWCGWCKKMDAETFTNPVIVKYMNEHFYAVKFNAETGDTIRFRDTTYTNRFFGSRKDRKSTRLNSSH